MKRRALVLCGDCWHPVETVRCGLENFSGDFQFEFSRGDERPSPERLKQFDVSVLARVNIASDQQAWLRSDVEHGLVDFVKRGGSLLAVHAGIARYESLPALHRLLGGA